MVVGSKFIKDSCVGKMSPLLKKSFLMIFVLFIVTPVFAQEEENISGIPAEKLGIPIEILRRDPLRDIPILSDDAVELAQSGVGSTSNPKDSNLQVYTETDETGNETSYLVWNITFGEPENKEVLVDANNGEIISIKIIAKAPNLKSLYLIFIIIIILVSVIVISIFLIRKMKKEGKLSEFEELKIR